MVIPSILFTILAWGLAVAAIAVKRRRGVAFLVAASFFFCCVSVLCPFFEIMGRVNAGDLSALLDTMRSMIIGVSVSMIGSLALNFIALKNHS